MANEARTIADLERKYNFAEMLGAVKNLRIRTKSIIQVQNEMLGFLDAVSDSLENLQDQVDGNITTWFFSGVPTLNNQPASEWEETEYSAHLGDLYYDTATGYAYRFALENTTYKWLKLTDSDVSEALALANAAQDTADSKRRIFVVQPIPPYDSGDIWINNHEIYRCQISKTAEQSYAASDWINDLKYTDNTYAQAIVDELGGTATQVLSGQVVLILENYAKFTDLATGGSTVINGSNITTGNIDTDHVTIGNGNVLMDDEGIHLHNGAKIVGRNGLMNTYMKNKEGFVGYFLQDPNQLSSEATKQNILMDVIIPEGFEITSAKIVGFHTPVYWGYLDGNYQRHNAWGYVRGLKAYKANNIYSQKMTADLFSEYTPVSEATYTEIANALGANGWTATAPDNTTHNTEKFESADIKSIFQNSNQETVAGLYQIKVEPEATPSVSWGTQGVVERSGYISSILIIEGYMTYT